MIRSTVPSFTSGMAAVVVMHLPNVASACTACMGDPNSKSAGAINAAVFLMLGFVALMLGSFSVFAWNLSRRATTGSAIPADHLSSRESPDAIS